MRIMSVVLIAGAWGYLATVLFPNPAISLPLAIIGGGFIGWASIKF